MGGEVPVPGTGVRLQPSKLTWYGWVLDWVTVLLGTYWTYTAFPFTHLPLPPLDACVVRRVLYYRRSTAET